MWIKSGLPLAMSLALGACAAEAQWWDPSETPGSLVAMSVEVDGRRAPLYRATDGAERFYLEAREGANYAVSLSNRTGERLGVVLTVDGLNAVSGERDAGTGRMYVLGPWEQVDVRGWRTSLSEVRRFTFVDERASYAARSGKANGRMGWIEAAVYRERRGYAVRPWPRIWPEADSRDDAPARERNGEVESMSPPATPPPTADEYTREDGTAKLEGAPADRSRAYPGARNFPGTGWGQRTEDRATVVHFEPETAPAERVTLRYEYRSALAALGILPRPWPARDRLRERERGDSGFVKPPAW